MRLVDDLSEDILCKWKSHKTVPGTPLLGLLHGLELKRGDRCAQNGLHALRMSLAENYSSHTGTRAQP